MKEANRNGVRDALGGHNTCLGWEFWHVLFWPGPAFSNSLREKDKKETDLFNDKVLAKEILSIQGSNSSISLCSTFHGHKSESTRVVGVWIAHDLGFLHLFAVFMAVSARTELMLTLPMAAKWFSKSLLSTRWLKPETWRLLPGF